MKNKTLNKEKDLCNFLAFLIIYLLFMSCSAQIVTQAPEHSIRVKNDYATAIMIKIGPLDFGTVQNNTTTEYMNISEGKHTVSGNTSDGRPISGYVELLGTGKHKSTLTITSKIEFLITKDL